MTILHITGCFPTLDITAKNIDSGTYNRVYVNLNFMCQGTVTGWKYMARGAGSVYLDVYRPEVDGTKTLITKTLVQADKAGEFIHMLHVNEYIRVYPGYHIGYHYQSGSSGAILSEVWSTESLAGLSYIQSHLSSIVSAQIYDDVLQIGVSQGPTLSTWNALPTYLPIIQCKSR